MKNPIRWIATGLTLLLLFVNSSCKNSTTDPPPKSNLGKRNYTWTVDTITYPGSLQVGMWGIYGTSNENVYAVGYNDQNRGKMFHFNGQVWSPVRLTASEGGPIQGAITPMAIDGRGPNDIWAVGEEKYYDPITRILRDSSLIIHYNGASWRKVQIDRGRTLQALTLNADGSAFAGGIYGDSYHYDGVSWRFIRSDTTIWFSNFGFDGQTEYGLAYTPGWMAGYYEVVYLLRWADPIWQILDSTSITSSTSSRFGHLGIKFIGNTGISAGYGVFQKVGSNWERVSTIMGTYGGISGTRPEHIFVVGDAVWHYNSENWQQLYSFAGSSWGGSDVWCSEDEVFIVGNDGHQSYVLHGK